MTSFKGRKHSDSRKGIPSYQSIIFKEIDDVIAAAECSNDNSVLQELCDKLQRCYFTGSGDENGFAKDYLFYALTDKLQRRCRQFGSLRDKDARKEAINIYNFLCTLYFHILAISWSELLVHFESIILTTSCYLLKPSSFGETSQISESLSTWLFKLGPYLHVHFPMEFGSLMDLVRDKFLDDMTTEHARQHLITLIDCHARGWVIRFG